MKKRQKPKWLLALALCLTALTTCLFSVFSPTLALPENINTETFTSLEGKSEIRVVASPNATGDIEIPAAINGQAVTAVADEAFKGCTSLRSVRFGVGLKAIGSKAFSETSSLVAVAIPSSATNISLDAFTGTSSQLKIYGLPGSYAQTFANSQGITFQALDGSVDYWAASTTVVSGTVGSTGSAVTLKPVGTPKNVYEEVNADGSSKSPKRYVYDNDDSISNGVQGPAYLKDGAYYTALLNYGGVFAQVNDNGSLLNTPVIWHGPDKTFGTADDQGVVLIGGKYYIKGEGDEQQVIDPETPSASATAQSSSAASTAAASTGTSGTGSTGSTATTVNLKPVGTPKNVYEEVNADGSSKNPKRYVYDNDDNVSNGVQGTAYLKDGGYWTELTAYRSVYVQIGNDGKLITAIGFWYGADQIFNTADDVAVVLKEGKYAVLNEDGSVKEWITPEVTSTNPSSSASVSSAGTGSGTDTSNTKVTLSDDFFNSTGGKDGPEVPPTGGRFSPGMAVCISLLTLASGYCATQLVRKRKAA
ncbi:MAG: leucine-rich repeat domain-containing protein [Oscillospiraceae bacterium]|jgi:hypothetical protein|nr:leucine-rich repeat domain-containing protein [Oscillospiraceae bacterium]